MVWSMLNLRVQIIVIVVQLWIRLIRRLEIFLVPFGKRVEICRGVENLAQFMLYFIFITKLKAHHAFDDLRVERDIRAKGLARRNVGVRGPGMTFNHPRVM